MSNWERIRQNVKSLSLDFNHDRLQITNRDFLDCIDTLAKYIPDDRLDARDTLGNFDFIRGWTDQILNANKKESFVALAILMALAHACEAVAKLPGGQFLIKEMSKHQARGLFDQLLVTYYLSHYIEVIAAEQDNRRVDIVARMGDKKINIHVKGTDPKMKEVAQFEAFGQLTQAMLAEPVVNKNGEKLELVLFDGYIPCGVKKDFWEEVWASIVARPISSLEITVPGSGREPDSKVRLGFSWEKERNGLRGEVRGINAFQTALNRIKEISASIPQASRDMEVAVLINAEAKHLKLGAGVLPKLRLDGVMALSIHPGSLGFHFERSGITLKPQYEQMDRALGEVVPSAIWLC